MAEELVAEHTGLHAPGHVRVVVLDRQKASVGDMLKNTECASIIQVVGAGSGRTFDLEQARYGKIIFMADADSDGAHIRCLLATLFFRYMRPLVEAGRVYTAAPALGQSFHELRRREGLSLAEVYTQGREREDLYQLAEALTDLDEWATTWRVRHFMVVERIIGGDVVGTQGTPVEMLGKLVQRKLYPELWKVRTELTNRAIEGAD